MQNLNCQPTPCAYNLQDKFIVLIEYFLIFLRKPLWLELVWCSVFIIDGVGELLSSDPSSVDCKLKCRFQNPIPSNAHFMIKVDRVLLPSMHVLIIIFSLLILFQIAETRAIFFLVLSTSNNYGDCIVAFMWRPCCNLC